MTDFSSSCPIGVFDSGVGGLTVTSSIIEKLPNESIIYIGDTANSPYGEKSLEDIKQLCIRIIDELVTRNVKAIVIACNTASSAVYEFAKEKYEKQLSIPIIEVICPTMTKAIADTKNKKLGLIATKLTVETNVYANALAKKTDKNDIELFSMPCPKFVTLIEKGIVQGQELTQTATEYLEPIKANKVDTLILGCTHFPLISSTISKIMGEEVKIVSSGDQTAKELKEKLEEKNLLNNCNTKPEYDFYTTGDKEKFDTLLKRFLKDKISKVNKISQIQIGNSGQ